LGRSSTKIVEAISLLNLDVPFSLMKILPSSSPDLDQFMDRISTPSPEPDPIFMDYIRKEIPFMFRPGWDKGYNRQTELAVTSVSACAEKSRMKGGCRLYWLERYHEEARQEFVKYLRGEEEHNWSRLPAKLTAIPTAGKVRLISVPSADAQLLLPLHKTMYNHISRFSWLLRGDAKSSSFKDFVRKDGQVFVSGDYESATDCLNQNVQKEILRLILQNAHSVPNAIRVEAMASLSAELSLKKKDGQRIETVRTGQMMGFPISFPLLCIVNYLAFRFATMDKSIPVKINGDDIVFRSTPSVASRWMDCVGKAGLKLSRGKTLVDCSIFTLNSTLFTASFFKVKCLPFIRSKALFGTEEGYTSLPGRFQSFAPAFGPSRKFRLRSIFLRQNIGFLTKSRRSLNRGLGMNVSKEMLQTTRLWSREIDYLSLPKEKKPPPTMSIWAMQPLGYRLEHREKKQVLGKEEKDELIDAVVNAAWRIPDLQRESFEEVYDGGINRPAINIARCKRLLGSRPCPLIEGSTGCSCLKDQIKSARLSIYESYLRTKVRTYPQWIKIKESTPPSSTDDDEGINSTPVPPIDLGSTTVWDISSRMNVLDIQSYENKELVIDDEEIEQTLRLVGSRCKLKVFSNGIGIGPPNCF